MLTLADCELILQSLEYTRQSFSRYAYPTEDVKAARLKDVQDAIDHVRALRNELKSKTK